MATEPARCVCPDRPQAGIPAPFAGLEQHPLGLCGEDFAAFLRKQYDDYRRVIREANIKAE
jgi:hypothetical protein